MEALLPLNLERGFDYLAPSSARPGDYTIVPLGKKTSAAVIWSEGEGDLPLDKLKPVTEILPLPPMPETLRAYLEWVARYTCTPLGKLLDMALHEPALAVARSLAKRYHAASHPAEKKLSPAEKRILKQLENNISLSALDLLSLTTSTTINRMVREGLLREEQLSEPPKQQPQQFQLQPPALNESQTEAAKNLQASIGSGHKTFLLEGITGSGKTEVYFEMIETTLKRHKQALVLLPEIALTVQWMERCEKRFGTKPVRWHSAMPPAERRKNWLAIVTGQARLIVGARSALFLPYPELGVIIVDEEHDGSYKQEEGVFYNARDMAIARASHEKIPICLVSATPSLETLRNIDSGKYTKLHLPARFHEQSLPSNSLIDMRLEKLPASRWLSSELIEKMKDRLEKKQQTLLFLNRRGYAPLLLCRACGHREECPSCSSWMVYHKNWGVQQCHHCGFRTPPPEKCSSCGAEGKYAAIGPGVERIAEEAGELFPQARILKLSSDDFSSQSELSESIDAIADGKADIIVGTQILAKGHHFPLLTLVGILDADLGLKGADYRAPEKTFQMLHQLSGRAGREAHAGEVLIQTYQPEHPVMRALAENNADKFIAEEKKLREALHMPPYGKLAAVILESLNEARVKKLATALARKIPSSDKIRVFGPAPAPLYRLRDYYRLRFLIKAPQGIALQPFIREWLQASPPDRQVKCKVDIDPYSFL